MHYEVGGSGTPLLLLHAGVADRRMWRECLGPLTRRFQVVTCDLRGYGESLLPDGTFAYHDDLLVLVDALGLDRVWLVGVSFGARVAVDFVLEYPDRVAGLILVSPTVDGFAPSEELEAFGELEETLLEAGRLEEATRLNVESWVDGPHRKPTQVDPTLRARVAEMQRTNFAQPFPPTVGLRRPEPRAAERLGELGCPLLLLSGALDVATFLDYGERIAAAVDGARHVVVPEVAHLIPMEVPELFVDQLTTFVEGATLRTE